MVYVHHLILLAFVGPRPEGCVTRHLDDDKANNRLGNLCYGTSTENNYDMVRNGKNRNANKTHCPQGRPYDEENTHWYGTGRHCRPCNRAAHRRSAQVRKQMTA
jgi:hypothetical protein